MILLMLGPVHALSKTSACSTWYELRQKMFCKSGLYKMVCGGKFCPCNRSPVSAHKACHTSALKHGAQVASKPTFSSALLQRSRSSVSPWISVSPLLGPFCAALLQGHKLSRSSKSRNHKKLLLYSHCLWRPLIPRLLPLLSSPLLLLLAWRFRTPVSSHSALPFWISTRTGRHSQEGCQSTVPLPLCRSLLVSLQLRLAFIPHCAPAHTSTIGQHA